MHSKVHYISFKESTGYGIAAVSLVNALKNLNVDVRVTYILPGDIDTGGKIVDETEAVGQTFDAVIIHTVPEYYPYWYKKEKARSPKAKIWGYTTWETDVLPKHWPTLLNNIDGVFVPSTWNKKVFEDAGIIKPIKVLPHVSEFEGNEIASGTSPLLGKILKQVSGHFVFYSINVWSERKSPWLLIKAFQEEFNPSEKVALILKTGSTDWTRKYERRWTNLFRKSYARASVAFDKLMKDEGAKAPLIQITEQLNERDIAYLHKACDCFVSTSRAEGWGMGAYEAAWFGKAVCMTGYGGALDFLPQEYAFLLKFTLVPVTSNKEQNTVESHWAEVDLACIRKTLRSIFENQQAAKEKGKQLQNFVSKHFNKSAIAENCLHILLHG